MLDQNYCAKRHKNIIYANNFTLNAEFLSISYRWVRPDLSDIGGQTFLMFEIPTGKTFVQHYHRYLRKLLILSEALDLCLLGNGVQYF